MYKIKLAMLTLLMLVVVGCESYVPHRYSVSTQHVLSLKKLKSNVKVGNFSQSDNIEDPMCRLAGKIKISEEKSYAYYIRGALIDELELADKYSNTSKNVITGHIEEVSFVSVTPAYWKIAGTFTVNGTHIKVSIKHNSKTSWSAESACRDVTDAFPDAVEIFISKLIKSKEFKSSIK